jgi:hypothetical protein
MKQDGNVLFLILIAVALFAALSYAVTSSSRSSSQGISKEKAKLYSANMLNFATSLENAITRMRINRHPDYGIDFASINTNTSAANNTCADDTCKIFHVNGGAVAPISFAEDMFDTSLSGASNPSFKKYIFRVMEAIDIGSNEDDLIFYINNLK